MSSPLAVDEPAFRLANVTSGAFDSYIRSFALAAKAWGHPFFLRFNWEMNETSFPWAEAANGNRPGDYVAAWRHVHDIFMSVGATNVTWVWCPAVDPYHQFRSLAALYPGSAYVDWSCLDGYNFPAQTSAKGWSSFDQIYSATYDQIVQTIAPGKPFMIGEVASSERGGVKAAWIGDMISKITNVYTALRAFVWFDWSVEGDDWPIETSRASVDAFAHGIAVPLFTTNTFGGLGPRTIRPPE
jgi:beta-mannanase